VKFSIAIPAYEYKGKGGELLDFSFEKMAEQTFKDFDVIISDHSVDSDVENTCKKWDEKLNIKYFKNETNRGNPASNLNNAIKNSDGEWVKILCQDDFLVYENSMEIISNNLPEDKNWMATGYIHTKDKRNYFNYHAPAVNPQLLIMNSIGTPSCVILKKVPVMPEFDEALKYAYDCEFYFRFWKQYGDPKIITDVTIANYLWENSITAQITQEFIQKENEYILKKHGIGVAPPNETKPA